MPGSAPAPSSRWRSRRAFRATARARRSTPRRMRRCSARRALGRRRRAVRRGGFMLDAGRGPDDRCRPIVSRLTFPEDWRILLILDRGSGRARRGRARRLRRAAAVSPRAAARNLPPRADAGAARRRGSGFRGVRRRREAHPADRLGDHFAPAQGGGRFTSARVGGVAERLEGPARSGSARVPGARPASLSPAIPTRPRNLARRAARERAASVDVRIARARDAADARRSRL